MKSSLEMLQEATEREVTLQCAGHFEEIALKYPEQWMPFYYASQVLTNITLGEQDMERGDSQLDHAKELLEKSLELNPEESEIHTLKALLLLARMSLDPYSRGPMYYEEYLGTLQKAKNLNPENPRVYLLEGLMTESKPEGAAPGKSDS